VPLASHGAGSRRHRLSSVRTNVYDQAVAGHPWSALGRRRPAITRPGGNVTSITRETAPAAGIIDINHAAPPPGVRSRSRRGFGAPRARTRSFNGVQAPVRSAAADRCRCTVPAGATTGLWWSTLGRRPHQSKQFVVPHRPPTVRGSLPRSEPPGTKVTVNAPDSNRTAGGQHGRMGSSRSTVESSAPPRWSRDAPAINGSGKGHHSHPVRHRDEHRRLLS